MKDEAYRAALQDWLRRACVAARVEKPSQLAERAGMRASTLLRFLNDPEWTGWLSVPTMRAVALVSGLEPPPMLGRPAAETMDAELVEGISRDIIEPSLDALIQPRQAVALVVRSRALLDEGYHPGDRILVDTAHREPGDGQIAALRRHAINGTPAAWLLRLCQGSWLIPHSPDRGHLVLARGDNGIEIAGTVVGSYRLSRAA